jgi:hypothetical protein
MHNPQNIFVFDNRLPRVFAVRQAQPAQAEDLPSPYQIVKNNLKTNNYITPIFDLKSREENISRQI